MSEPLEVDLLLQELKKCGLGYTIGTYMGFSQSEIREIEGTTQTPGELEENCDVRYVVEKGR